MKVLVIGSGPIVIGQAAEFDYAGTQACKALREEGHTVVLINSNPATIMTDPEVSDALYIEPLNVDFCERVIARERPDALLPTLGGQTGLNLATQLADGGVLEKYGVRVIGTPLSAIRKAEDREQFRELMREIKEPVPESWIIETVDQLEAVLDVVPYPCIIRPAYTLGGTGGGVANTPEELLEIGGRGLKLSMRSQIMVERSLLGWKEVEYEVMRDRRGNCITVCNMENLDPMGVHTGDSIVVAPSQTLSDIEYHMLRTASLKIIRALGIEGGCNVQLAVNPESFDYYIIEVNPRVSRSSALASKATGYPIARVAAKIAVGRTLDEIDNQVTGTTKAAFVPALDYCVVKIPRWPFDKFPNADRSLFTQMKATGEVMAIDRSFEAALMKAVRGLEVKRKDLSSGMAGPALGTPPGHDSARSMLASRASGPWLGRPAPEPPAEFINPDREIQRRQGTFLPHWTQAGGTYAVTFRLADSLPSGVRDQLKWEREHMQRLYEGGYVVGSEDQQRGDWLFSEKVDSLLAAGAGSCVLREPEHARAVANALEHFNGDRYTLFAWCIMPNHVHAVVRPHAPHELPEILHSWKSFAAKEVNRALDRTGELWLEEYYDHLIRDAIDFARQLAYITAHPVKAELGEWPWVWPMGDSTTACPGAGHPSHDSDLEQRLRKPTDERLWALAEALRAGWSVDDVNRVSRVDKWFLRKIEKIVTLERRLSTLHEHAKAPEKMFEILTDALTCGYTRESIERLAGVTEELKLDLRALRTWSMAQMSEGEIESVQSMRYSFGTDKAKSAGITHQLKADAAAGRIMSSKDFYSKYRLDDPVFLSRMYVAGELGTARVPQAVYKMVDTCAGEFESHTPYYYSTYEAEDDAVPG